MFGLFKKIDVYYSNNEDFESYSTPNADIQVYKGYKSLEEFRSYVNTIIYMEKINKKNILDSGHVITFVLADYRGGHRSHTYTLNNGQMRHISETSVKGRLEYKHIKKAIETGDYIDITI